METQRLKVLFVSSWYPNRVKPTLGNFVQKHAEAVSEFADVCVLHVCFDKHVLSAKPEIIEEKNGNINTITIYLKKCLFPPARFFKYLNAYKTGYRLVQKKFRTPNIIHANVLLPLGIIFLFLKNYKRIPYVFTEHWAGYLPEYPMKTSLLKKHLLKRIIRNAAAVLPVTKDLENSMKELGFKGNYPVVPNVVDTSLFVPAQKNNSSVKHIIHVSSFDEKQKNFCGILDALNQLSTRRSDFVIDIISDGDYRQYQSKIEELQLSDKLVFHGQKNTSEVAAIMQNCDFLLLFSNYENFPCVIAEAMACGLPVLTTHVGGIAEHVNESNGILVEAQDINALIAQLEIMLGKCSSYDKNEIRNYAEKHFSYEVVGKKIINIYRSCLSIKTDFFL
ncbi:MAG: glycosyltransferase [Bacteroidales bacterium]|nr:glycosyltransferase [Bacteroidales bacterium]